MAIVGDVIPHAAIQAQVHSSGFDTLWPDRAIIEVIAGADIAAFNLETPVAPGLTASGPVLPSPEQQRSGKVYTGYPFFNAQPVFLGGLRDMGFDVAFVANNHILDRGVEGLDRTLEQIERHGLSGVGARPQQTPRGSWIVVREVRGLRIAWLACTMFLNHELDAHQQVLNCRRDKAWIGRELRRLRSDAAIAAVVVAAHWGKEGTPQPIDEQREFARFSIEHGATLVVGSHPHVVQRWELIPAPVAGRGLVMYSLGNFLSSARSAGEAIGVIALVQLSRRSRDGKAEISKLAYVPTLADLASNPSGRLEVRVRRAPENPGAGYPRLREVLDDFDELDVPLSQWAVGGCG